MLTGTIFTKFEPQGHFETLFPSRLIWMVLMTPPLRSNHRRSSVALKNFAIFTGKHLCWSLFFKVCNFIKKRLQHRCFPVDIAKYLTTPILKNICEHLTLVLSNNFQRNSLPNLDNMTNWGHWHHRRLITKLIFGNINTTWLGYFTGVLSRTAIKAINHLKLIP